MLIKSLILQPLGVFLSSFCISLGCTSEGVKLRLGEVEISSTEWDGSCAEHITLWWAQISSLCINRSILTVIFKEMDKESGKEKMWKQGKHLFLFKVFRYKGISVFMSLSVKHKQHEYRALPHLPGPAS